MEFHWSASEPRWHSNRGKLPPKVFPWMASTLVQSVLSLVCSPWLHSWLWLSFLHRSQRDIFKQISSCHCPDHILLWFGVALKIQPQLLSMALRAFQVPGDSRPPNAPSPRAPPHAPFRSLSSPETSPTAALSHLLLPQTGNTQCLSRLPGTWQSHDKQFLNGSLFHYVSGNGITKTWICSPLSCK